MPEQKKEFMGVWIPKHVIEDEELSMTEKFIYAEISCFEICYMKNEQIGKRYKLKENTISILIKKLKEKGYVEEVSFNGRSRGLQAIKDKPNQRQGLIKIKGSIGEKSKAGFDKNISKTLINSLANPKRTIIDNNKENNKETNLANSNEFANNDINYLIGKFKPINPTYEKLFKNITQRKALERLVNKFSFKKIVEIIEILPTVVGQKYAPVITTPLQLEDKLGQFLIFIKNNNLNSNVTKI